MSAMTADKPTPLIDRLPAVRGRLTAEAPLAGITWFRVGGAAEVMFRPADRDDLIAFLRAKPTDVPVTVLGVASNVLQATPKPFAVAHIEGPYLHPQLL